MGFGKKLKKAFKKVAGVVKKAWKGVQKLVETVAKVIVDALKFVWKEVIMPILDWLANLLGLKDKELIQVAANTQPLFEEKKAWLFNDNIILKSLIDGSDVVDEMRDTILYGSHNDVRGYVRYGEKDYARGLPSITLSAGKTTNSDRSSLAMWGEHCKAYGYPNPFTTVASLPIRDNRFDIVQATKEGAIDGVLALDYQLNTETSTIVKGGNSYSAEQQTLVSELVYKRVDPNWDPDNDDSTPEEDAMRTDVADLEWSMTIIRLDQYVELNGIPEILNNVLDMPSLNTGGYTLAGTLLEDGLAGGFTLDLDDVGIDEFPLVFGFNKEVRLGEAKSWTVEREVTLIEIPVPEPEEGEEPEDPTYYEVVEFVLYAGEIEEDPFKIPDVELLTGVIEDALMTSFQFSFYVTNPAYTPYPDNLNYQFLYLVPQERTTEADFTGGGANDSIFENYSEDFMDALPVVVLKEEGTWIDENKDSSDYKTSDKLLSKIKLQVQPLVDGIRGSSKDADDNLETAVFRLGVDVMSKNQGCLAYVFEFLNFIHATSIASKADYDKSNRNDSATAVQGRTTNHITLQEGSFVSSYSYNYSVRSVVTGLGPVRRGSYTRSATDNSNYTIIRHNGDGTGVQLFISGFAGAYVVRPQGASKAKMAAMSFTDSDDPDFTSNLVLPIMVGAWKKIRPLQRQEVIARSQYLTVLSGTYQKIRWYKDPKFIKIVGIIIIIVVSVMSLGTLTAPTTAGVAAATAAVVALVVNLVIQLVIRYAVSRLVGFVLAKIVRALGGSDLAIVIAAAAMVAAGMAMGIPPFDAVMGMVNASSDYVNTQTQNQVKKFEKERNAFESDASKLQKEHDETLKGLEVRNVLGLSSMYMYKAESPDLFFSRAELDSTELLTSLDVVMGLNSDIDFMTT